MSEKPKPISAKVRAAIDAMVAGDARTVTDAAAVAGALEPRKDSCTLR